ncbi:hypothetical protein GCM10007231_31350 [Nocardioides daphniae]|uniref:Energy transducer TonB n=1 Tax=Nocardioides daphniae TaxID=402297 RepID=A0ABQ1QJ56_9ACTN|nr:hypothetical protein GCM10007231_31350 [Nocardioides daphniae]
MGREVERGTVRGSASRADAPRIATAEPSALGWGHAYDAPSRPAALIITIGLATLLHGGFFCAEGRHAAPDEERR